MPEVATHCKSVTKMPTTGFLFFALLLLGLGTGSFPEHGGECLGWRVDEAFCSCQVTGEGAVPHGKGTPPLFLRGGAEPSALSQKSPRFPVAKVLAVENDDSKLDSGSEQEASLDEVVSSWDMLTGKDRWGINVTMFQCREWPYIQIQVWWQSLGSLKFSYEETAEDVMGIWPHGGTSNSSAWDVDDLPGNLSISRGEYPLHSMPVELGNWKMGTNGRYISFRNPCVPNNELILTRKGFYYFDRNGYTTVTKGGQPPLKMPYDEACRKLGISSEGRTAPKKHKPFQWPPNKVLNFQPDLLVRSKNRKRSDPNDGLQASDSESSWSLTDGGLRLDFAGLEGDEDNDPNEFE